MWPRLHVADSLPLAHCFALTPSVASCIGRCGWIFPLTFVSSAAYVPGVSPPLISTVSLERGITIELDGRWGFRQGHASCKTRKWWGWCLNPGIALEVHGPVYPAWLTESRPSCFGLSSAGETAVNQCAVRGRLSQASEKRKLSGNCV